MRRNLWLAVAACAGVAAVAAVVATRFEHRREQQRFALFTKYCTDCHNAADFAGDLSFEHVVPESVPQHAAQFEAAIVKLRGRLMPPPGSPQPSKDEIDGLVATLERTIDEHAPKQAGYVAAQRLDRTEYANAVKALLDVDIDPKEYLPAEIEIRGFTNIAAALSTSPSFVEQYVDAAGAVAHLAVGEPKPKVANAYFPPPTTRQDAYVPGLPLGTRGGMKFTHAFPADGEYRLTIGDLGLGLYPRAVETRQTLVVLVDRAEQFRADIGGPEDLALVNLGGAPARAEVMSRFKNIPLKVTAGAHEVAVTFIERSRAADDEQIADYGPSAGFAFSSGQRVAGVLGGINMTGPFNSTGLTKTESRKKLFVCEPEVAARERECAQQITASLARRAFRRPVSQSDVDRLMAFFDEGRKGAGGFDEGIEVMTTAVLSSPDFLYRSIAPAKDADASSHELSPLELASRLSFFLWSQGPDDELLKLAESGELKNPSALGSQVARMLKDPRAEVLVTSFAEGWLRVADLDAIQPDKNLYPEFNEGLRQDFAEEIKLFLASVLLDDRNVQTLLTADYTFLNERLARHYGIDGVAGPQFRQVKLADPVRHGLLGKGAVLLRTSYGNRTSPVLRGQWVLDKLMGTPPTPPPPGVETNLDTPEGEQPKTVRARLQLHRKSPTCAACHGVIDPYGLALENFTAIGAWRTTDKEAGAPIDPHSELSGGRPVDGPAALTAALLARDDQFVQALTQKLMMYALGRELEYYDMPQVRAIVRAAKGKDYRFSALVAGIVQSDAFRMQAARPEAESSNRGSAQASLGATGQ
jgi:mono/diheme cytochrome c family protein